MSKWDHRKSHSQQVRMRFPAILSVLTLLTVPILVFAFAKQVRSDETTGTNNFSIWLDGPNQATQGETISFDIETDAGGLYGLQFEIAFDPAILQAVDTQLTPGDCPMPDFVIINTIDNNAGKISYAASSLAPTLPCDGGTVASFQFQVSQTASLGSTSAIQFNNVILADNNGTEIPVKTVDLNLEIVVTKAYFNGVPTTGPAPLTVNFTDLSSGEYDTCTWDFGDSSGSNICGNQSHVYTTPGSYTVSLSVSGPIGSDSETKVDYIIVSQQHNLFLPVILADYR